MKKEFVEQYIVDLYHDVPTFIYVILLLFLVIFLGMVLRYKGDYSKRRTFVKFILFEYVFLIICSTVLFRPESVNKEHSISLFWSYNATTGNQHLLLDNILNTLVFVPIGLMFNLAIKNSRWWKAFLSVLCLSISIEVLQMVLNKGFAEFDDVMHNVLGCMLGYGVFVLINTIYERIFY